MGQGTRPHAMRFQALSCSQYSPILVMISVNAMAPAKVHAPVMIQEITKVSIVPVMRQLTALAKLRR